MMLGGEKKVMSLPIRRRPLPLLGKCGDPPSIHLNVVANNYVAFKPLLGIQVHNVSIVSRVEMMCNCLRNFSLPHD